jgi:hypothetical protein
MAMRVVGATLSFVFALVIGAALARYDAIIDSTWPSFTYHEASAKLGTRVVYRQNEKFILMKCSIEGPCVPVGQSEQGTVIGMQLVADGGYFLRVAWPYAPNSEDFVSYVGRYSYRHGLVEFHLVPH